MKLEYNVCMNQSVDGVSLRQQRFHYDEQNSENICINSYLQRITVFRTTLAGL